MRAVDIHEARTHLSRLVEQAAKGEPKVEGITLLASNPRVAQYPAPVRKL